MDQTVSADIISAGEITSVEPRLYLLRTEQILIGILNRENIYDIHEWEWKEENCKL